MKDSLTLYILSVVIGILIVVLPLAVIDLLHPFTVSDVDAYWGDTTGAEDKWSVIYKSLTKLNDDLLACDQITEVEHSKIREHFDGDLNLRDGISKYDLGGAYLIRARVTSRKFIVRRTDVKMDLNMSHDSSGSGITTFMLMTIYSFGHTTLVWTPGAPPIFTKLDSKD